MSKLLRWSPPIFGWQYQLEEVPRTGGVQEVRSVWETDEGDPYDIVIRGQRYHRTTRWQVIITWRMGAARTWFDEENHNLTMAIRRIEKRVLEHINASINVMNAINSEEEWD